MQGRQEPLFLGEFETITEIKRKKRSNSQLKNLRFGLTAGSESWFESSFVSQRAIPFSESQSLSIQERTQPVLTRRFRPQEADEPAQTIRSCDSHSLAEGI